MKPIFTLTLLSLIASYSSAQDTIQQLDYNNVNVTLTNSGPIFNNDLFAGYEIPKGSGLNMVFTSAFWFAAEDGSGNVRTVLGGYTGVGTDIDQGPFSSTLAYNDPSYNQSYMVTICQEEIDQFNLWWECSNGVTNVGCAAAIAPSTETLTSIYNWPASGDVLIGQSSLLAPFFDRNSDGIYDPIGAGDYPIIKGCCATYMIQNDLGNIHTSSGTDPIGIEMHYMFYQFGANDLLYNTTFVDVMAINKSGTDYPAFSQGYFIDGDLGSYADDFMGSDSVNNMLIFYNGDNLDENGYGADPPAFGVVALENPLTSIVPYSSNNQNYVVGVLNQMRGLRADGSGWTDPNGNATKFAFSGNPNDPSSWSQLSAGSVSGDNRSVMSTSHNQFNVGDTVKQTYALIYSRIGNNLENAEHLSTLAAEVKAFYDSGDDGCEAGGFVGTSELESAEIVIYPNPNNGIFKIENPNLQIQSIRVVDLTGKEIDFSKEGTSVLSISLEDKSSGIYIINIQTKTGLIVERLVVE